MTGRWPLVGRGEEIASLHDTLADAAAHTVVLAGPAGVGKTRLVEEFAGQAAASGRVTCWVTGTKTLATVAFGAFAHLLPASSAEEPTPAQVMRMAVDEFARRASTAGLVLCVDDAHLLDASSAVLVHTMARNGFAFVVATVRSGEQPPESVVALWKDGLGPRVELPSLSRARTARLLAEVLGGQVDTATEYRLWRSAQGNALYLRELVLTGLEQGLLTARGGVWSWTGELACGERLGELIRQRVGEVDQAQRDTLELLALAEPVGPAFLGDDPAVLETLEQRGLVTVTMEGRRCVVRLAHPLYGETLRAGMGTLRRRALHTRLADTLTACGARRHGDVLRLATWRLDDGDADAEALLAGARQARALSDHALAERLATAALTAGAGREAATQLADALFWQDKFVDAGRVLDQLVPEAGHAGEWEAIVTSSCLFWGLGEVGRADKVLGAHQDSAHVAAHWASLLMFNGRAGQALALAEPILSSADSDDVARARALIAAVPAWALVGRGDTAVAAATAGLAVAAQVAEDEPVFRGYVVAGQATAYWLLGDLDAMENIVCPAYESAARRPDELDGLWALQLARVAMARGKPRSALRLCREASARFREHDVIGQLPSCLATTAMAYAMLGEPEEATHAATAAQQALRPAVRVVNTELLLAQAWAAAARGERTSARELAMTAANDAADLGLKPFQSWALHEALRLGQPDVSMALAADGPLVKLYADHAAAHDGPTLDSCAERFAAAGFLLLAAETSAQAALAHVHDQDARNSRQKALAWANHCEGASTAILRTVAIPQVTAISEREREIAELAARGLSNRQIADLLVISIRTVGNHLNHIYTKLGINSRSELAALLHVIQ
ncbi:LuxR C-terminal-related transcriptional regulator [Actinocrispum wychmicini]|nr:LuxR family transcriptional regulator [Actinocrispum wychmicini]